MNISNQVSSSTKFLLLCYVMAVVLFPILSALLVLVLQMSTISIERSSIGTSSQVYWWQKVSTINPWWTGYCTFVMASVAWLEYPIWFWMVGGSFTCQLRGKQIAVRGIFWGEIPVHINQKCNQTNRYLYVCIREVHNQYYFYYKFRKYLPFFQFRQIHQFFMSAFG